MKYQMKWAVKQILSCSGVALLLASGMSAHAFALLGPYESWMEATNGFGLPLQGIWSGVIVFDYTWVVPAPFADIPPTASF